jgi:hypothetical protein
LSQFIELDCSSGDLLTEGFTRKERLCRLGFMKNHRPTMNEHSTEWEQTKEFDSMQRHRLCRMSDLSDASAVSSIIRTLYSFALGAGAMNWSTGVPMNALCQLQGSSLADHTAQVTNRGDVPIFSERNVESRGDSEPSVNVPRIVCRAAFEKALCIQKVTARRAGRSESATVALSRNISLSSRQSLWAR